MSKRELKRSERDQLIAQCETYKVRGLIPRTTDCNRKPQEIRRLIAEADTRALQRREEHTQAEAAIPAPLPNDLLLVIGTYTTFEPTIDLTGTVSDLAIVELYPTNSALWRNKTKQTTKGLEHVTEIILQVGYRHYYRLRTRDTYGPKLTRINLTDLYGEKPREYTDRGAYLVAGEGDRFVYVDGTHQLREVGYPVVSPGRGYIAQVILGRTDAIILNERGEITTAQVPGVPPISTNLLRRDRGVYTSTRMTIPSGLAKDEIVSMSANLSGSSSDVTVLTRAGAVYSWSRVMAISIAAPRVSNRVVALHPRRDIWVTTAGARSGAVQFQALWLTPSISLTDRIVYIEQNIRETVMITESGEMTTDNLLLRRRLKEIGANQWRVQTLTLGEAGKQLLVIHY